MPNAPSRGSLYALAAYGVWGLFPIYWKLIKHVPPSEVIAQRVLWSLLFLLCILGVRRRLSAFTVLWREPTLLLALSVSTLLIGANWYTYIWAVTNNNVLEASLGYFLTPLVNVLLGIVFLRERLRPGQALATGLGALGVALLTLGQADFPWLAVSLAFSFGFYGLVRKRAAVDALLGLSVETALLAGPALAFLVFRALHAELFFGRDWGTSLFLALAGVITAVPLLCFAAAARLMPLSALSFYQYISPSVQFLLAVLVFGEAFDMHRLAAFALIWSGLLVFSLEGFWNSRRMSTSSV